MLWGIVACKESVHSVTKHICTMSRMTYNFKGPIIGGIESTCSFHIFDHNVGTIRKFGTMVRTIEFFNHLLLRSFTLFRDGRENDICKILKLLIKVLGTKQVRFHSFKVTEASKGVTIEERKWCGAVETSDFGIELELNHRECDIFGGADRKGQTYKFVSVRPNKSSFFDLLFLLWPIYFSFFLTRSRKEKNIHPNPL